MSTMDGEPSLQMRRVEKKGQGERVSLAGPSSRRVVERIADLLPAEALEEAPEGLSSEETRPWGLLTQRAGRVIEVALGAS